MRIRAILAQLRADASKIDANLALKEDALKKTSPVNASVGRFKPDDQLLSFLRNL
jgi:integrase/recombinase XerD